MPYTISHMGLLTLIPRKFHQNLTKETKSLILIGAMGPDLSFFIPMPLLMEDYSHHPFWGLLVNFPLVFALWLFWRVIKPDLNQFVYSVHGEAKSFREIKTPHWAQLAMGYFIGHASHILLDLFTHSSATKILFFSEIAGFQIGGVPIYNILQITLSILGIVLGVFSIFRSGKRFTLLSVFLGVISIILSWTFMCLKFFFMHGSFIKVEDFIPHHFSLIVSLTQGFFFSWVAFWMMWKVLQEVKGPNETRLMNRKGTLPRFE